MMEEAWTEVNPPPPSTPTDLIKVYMDNFIGMTNHLSHDHLLNVSWVMLHGTHSIFPSPAITGHCGQDPVSKAKLAKGKGTWSYKKEILRWIFDGKISQSNYPNKNATPFAN